MEIKTKMTTKVERTPRLSFVNVTPEVLDSEFAKACMEINAAKEQQEHIKNLVFNSQQVFKMSEHVMKTLEDLAEEGINEFNEYGPLAIGTNMTAFIALGWYLRDQFENKEMVN